MGHERVRHCLARNILAQFLVAVRGHFSINGLIGNALAVGIRVREKYIELRVIIFTCTKHKLNNYRVKNVIRGWNIIVTNYFMHVLRAYCTCKPSLFCISLIQDILSATQASLSQIAKEKLQNF